MVVHMGQRRPNNLIVCDKCTQVLFCRTQQALLDLFFYMETFCEIVLACELKGRDFSLALLLMHTTS